MISITDPAVPRPVACQDRLQDSARKYRQLTQDGGQPKGSVGPGSFWATAVWKPSKHPDRFAEDGCGADRTDLKNLSLWKFPITIGSSREVPPAEVRDQTDEAVSVTAVRERIETLTKLRGVGLPRSLAALTLWNSERHMPMGHSATAGIREVDNDFNIDLWERTTGADRDIYTDSSPVRHELSNRTSLSLRDGDRALFLMGEN